MEKRTASLLESGEGGAGSSISAFSTSRNRGEGGRIDVSGILHWECP